MIENIEELKNFKGAVVKVSDDVVKELIRVCPQTKFLTKDRNVLTRHQIDEYLNKVKSNNTKMEKAREGRKSKGGRYAIPDLTAEEFEKLSPKEQLTYKNRIWKRNSRNRLKEQNAN